MLTNSYENWMRRPLSSAVCPTPDLWPEELVKAAQAGTTRGVASRRRAAAVSARSPETTSMVPRRDSATCTLHLNGNVTNTDSWHAATVRATYDTLDRETMMNEEKARILKMLEDRKITADEAMKLLEALDRTESRPTDRELKKKWLHVRVIKDGKQTVNLKLPLSLLKFGFKFAPGIRKAQVHSKARAERARERAMERAERARERAQRARERMEQRLRDKYGPEPGFDLESIIEEALSSMPMPPEPPEVPDLAELSGGAKIHSMLNGVADGDFDLDLDKILEMASDPDFDGNILDVYDDDDDEHVMIRLE